MARAESRFSDSAFFSSSFTVPTAALTGPRPARVWTLSTEVWYPGALVAHPLASRQATIAPARKSRVPIVRRLQSSVLAHDLESVQGHLTHDDRKSLVRLHRGQALRPIGIADGGMQGVLDFGLFRGDAGCGIRRGAHVAVGDGAARQAEREAGGEALRSGILGDGNVVDDDR